jgi:hypothetical protein
MLEVKNPNSYVLSTKTQANKSPHDLYIQKNCVFQVSRLLIADLFKPKESILFCTTDMR